MEEEQKGKALVMCENCLVTLRLIAETPIGMTMREARPQSGLYSIYFQRTAYYECPACKEIYSQTRSRQAAPVEKTFEEMKNGWAALLTLDCGVNIALGEVDKGELVPEDMQKEPDCFTAEAVEWMAEKSLSGKITWQEMNLYANHFLSTLSYRKVKTIRAADRIKTPAGYRKKDILDL